MTYTKHPFDEARDFARVRDFLIASRRRTPEVRNWSIDRWEFCRSFVHTLFESGGDWPATVGLWTDETDRLAAVATGEGEGHGEAHFLLDLPPGPIPDDLKAQLFDHLEAHLAASVPFEGASIRLRLWEGYDDLAAEARRRGLKPVWSEVTCHRPIDPDEVPYLPPGYRWAWGTQVDDEAKGAAHAGAFGYGGPLARRAAAAWASMRTMADWRDDLELFVMAPDGSVASFVNLWLDAANAQAILEPVGTVPAHRRRGLGRALIVEGARRAHALGARELLVASDQPFYLSCGFVPRERHPCWER